MSEDWGLRAQVNPYTGKTPTWAGAATIQKSKRGGVMAYPCDFRERRPLLSLFGAPARKVGVKA